MTQVEKARAYDEALALMQDCIPDANGLVHVRPDEIFPELKEGEDERIRKVLIDYFNRYKEQEECGVKTFYGIPTDNILAWLEKQGQKPIAIDIDKMVDDYANNNERGNEEFGKPINCMIRAYRQGLNDAYCQANCKGYQETGRCFVDGGCEAKKSQRMISAEAKEALYDKPTWSAEDEEEFKIAIETLHAAGQHSSANWLKSRKIGGKL